MPTATVTSKGQVTIPKAIRDQLGLEPGDRLRFIERDGEIILEAETIDVRELFGRLKVDDAAALSVEDMDDAIGDAVAARLEFSRK